MVMDPSFSKFSNSTNGLEFDDDTISPTFDHSETLANTFKFKDDPVGLNGFECDHDTISPTFDQFETLANTFKFKDDPVDLSFMDCPYGHPDSNPGLVSLTSNGSSELDSPDDGDLSDDVFKYVNSILMEENMEQKPNMFHDPLALKATEKSLYDVIGEKYPDSPNQPPPYFNQNIKSPDSLFGSSSEQSANSNTNNSVDSQWIC
ncbi:GRAS family transcription factor [Actinidia rufa]|uniref:GRAS family transcription factor n=1 Tax=Actinidia rufa TaxID=165716 RepID=A0A7J0H4K5_9ERIC|nr:GRAS family transcription factor [Actinidia rufa]